MNRTFRKYLTDTEAELIERTKPKNLEGLDEDELGDLHDKVRRASRKYRKLHRRQASSQVRAGASHGAAASKNLRTSAKAEVFDDALARVSRSLSRVAKASAETLKADRLAMARGGSSGPTTSTTPAKSSEPGRRPAKKCPPAVKERHASTLAEGQRRQATGDTR